MSKKNKFNKTAGKTALKISNDSLKKAQRIVDVLKDADAESGKGTVLDYAQEQLAYAIVENSLLKQAQPKKDNKPKR